MGGNEEVAERDAPSILIIDDDPDICQLLTTIFRGQGYQTSVAYSGPEALAHIHQKKPDLLILDVMMPGMDGWETFSQVRNLIDVPVIFLSALNARENQARAREAGVNDFIQKPFYPGDLLARSEALLGVRRAQAVSTGLMAQRKAPPQQVKVSVVIPTLNEARNLPLVLPYMPLEGIDEVFLVDGGSTDGTVEVARRLLPSIQVVIVARKGKGVALRAGYQAASGDIIIVLDADGSHDPREIPRYIRALIEGADFVKGSRFAPQGGTTDMPRFRKWGNGFFVWLVNLLFNCTFTDITFGYHAFWRYCLNMIEYTDIDGFEFEPAIYLRAMREKLRIVEVASFEGYRFTGVGKLKTIPDGWRILRTILREKREGLRTPRRKLHIGFMGSQMARVWLPTSTQVSEPHGQPVKNGQVVEQAGYQRVEGEKSHTLPTIERLRANLNLYFTIRHSMQDDAPVDLLRHVLQLSLESFDATSGSLLTLNDQGEVSHAWLACEGRTEQTAAIQVTDTVQRGLAGWVIKNRVPTLVPNTLDDPRWLRRSWEERERATRAAVAIPLLRRGEITGVMVLARPSARQFTEDELNLLTQIAV
ncbi:MAG TPA: response regulator [Anaerolineales bacterium]|nr:response regulator [Anaerolineales bacterium]